MNVTDVEILATLEAHTSQQPQCPLRASASIYKNGLGVGEGEEIKLVL